MGNKAKSKIGEPPDQWPLLTAAVSSLPSPPPAWPAECGRPSFTAVEILAKVAANRKIADAIMELARVDTWIKKAGKVDRQDPLACRLVIACGDFLANAKLSWKTPGDHKIHYEDLAKQLRKLRDKMRSDNMPTIQSHAEDLDRAAVTAERLASNTAGFTIAKPRFQYAARNDFIRALSAWLRENEKAAMHELTADIANALFPHGKDNPVTATKVHGLVRKR